ncbi:CDC45 family [Dipodascopsis uninucleata]
MFVVPTSYADAFEDLRSSSLSHTTCRLVVFVACLDVDALCAAKILAGILKRDLIPHRTCPVTGYSELKTRFQELEEDVANVVLIGCGALIDLADLFDGADDGNDRANTNSKINESSRQAKENSMAKRRIYVFDSHRPWNLHNVFLYGHVVCFDDGDIEEGQSDKLREAAEGLIEVQSLLSEIGSDDGDESDEVDDDEGDNDSISTDREIIDDFSDQEDNSLSQHNSDAESDDEGRQSRQASPQSSEISSIGSKRKEPSSPRDPSNERKRSAKAMRKNYKAVISTYYGRGTTYSTPVASQMYTLLSLLGDITPNDLWLSIVGTTAADSYAPQIYRQIYPLLRDEVERLNPPDRPTRFSADDTAMTIQHDYRLFLLRHWSLYESLVHSPFVFSRLKLWTDDGRKALHKFLAKMGISLQQARERWTHVDISVKRELKDRISTISNVFSINGIIRMGVVRKFGFRGQVTAGDAVEAIRALLECGQSTSLGKENIDPSHKARGNLDLKDLKNSTWVDRFWTGWDALDSIDKLYHGLSRAQFLQQAVVRTGTALLEKNQVLVLRIFRLVVLKDGPELELFRNPVTLSRLAIWVSECAAELDQKNLPIVIAALDKEQDLFTVVGLPPRIVNSSDKDAEDDEADEEETTGRNSFGFAFRDVAAKINATIQIDSFESAVVEVRREDLGGFLEGLTGIGIA